MKAPTWRRRLTLALVLWAVLSGMSLWLGVTTHLLVLGLLVLGVLAVGWLCRDVGTATAAWSWSLSSPLAPAVNRGRDVRIGQLRRAVLDALAPSPVPEDRLRPVLTDLVEGRLRAHHGLDLTGSATRLRPLLGAELDDYLRGRAPTPLTTEGLSVLIDRIEDL